jgi:hypothetical protein
MKKKILYGLAVALIAVVATVNVQIAANNKGEASDLMLENVEALAGSPEGGIAVSRCYAKVYGRAGEGSYYTPCNSKTSGTMFYKCPSPTEGIVPMSSAAYYCIK